MAALAALRFGVRFHPTPAEAIGLYLRRWIAGDPVPDAEGIIHAADVYGHPPADLAAAFPRLPKTHDRYFYTTCKRVPIRGGAGYRTSRAVAGVSWGTNNNKPVVDAVTGEPIGFVETLKYGKTDWLMEEFHRLPEEAAADGIAESVLCRLYVKEHAKPGSLAVAESIAGDRILQQEPAAAAGDLLLQQAAMAAGPQRMPPSSPRNRRVMALPVLPAPAPATIQQKRAAPVVADAPRPKKRARAAAAPAAATRPVMASPPAATAPPAPKVVPLRQVPRPSGCPRPPPGLLGLEPRRPTLTVAELMALFEKNDSAVQEEAAQEEEEDEWTDLETETAAIPTEEDDGAAARSLEGLDADEREDDAIALDISDVLSFVDVEDDGDGAWERMPLSDLTDLQY
ncbi:uncharacterized protein LOC104585070 [Brachypodium distachyon]|uniref:uncharacterized protein LOC104585070 n=1 Tax=Brachypodium distachyon TaxID=15368 RepID=UPI00052FEE9E|nr:uncharacterized protein LOC104585070 [Brachypodium distachyon]|eukprot:XP_010239312.1 uncharacterized protein LOC104585070 [Brachypodium distachyon]